jgi:hypothetical protein
VVGCLGVAALAAFFYAGRLWRRPLPGLLAALSWIAFSALVALEIGVGRAESGGPAAMAPRYVTLSTPFWLGLVVVCSALAQRGATAWRWAARATVSMIAAGVLVSSLHAMPVYAQRHRLLEPMRAELLRGERDELLALSHPDVQHVRRNLGVLRNRRLSVFREETPALAPARTVPLTTFAQFLEAEPVERLAPGELRSVPVWVANPSDVGWSATADRQGVGAVSLSYHWFDETGRAAVYDGLRTPLPGDLLPGSSLLLAGQLRGPDRPGRYLLRWTMVQDGVEWFDMIVAGAEEWVEVTP